MSLQAFTSRWKCVVQTGAMAAWASVCTLAFSGRNDPALWMGKPRLGVGELGMGRTWTWKGTELGVSRLPVLAVVMQGDS